MLEIPDLLTPGEAAYCRSRLEAAAWHDGRLTAGHGAIHAKRNQQLADDDPLASELGALILKRLAASERFMAAALPHKILPPRFNRYAGAGTYGDHIDNAVFRLPRGAGHVRSDLSATLFFSEPGTYEGGELVIQAGSVEQRVKLPAGHLILYPASTLHRVTPVTRGARLAAFFWIESMVREVNRRRILLELHDAVRMVEDGPARDRLVHAREMLLREWVEA
ncbi:Fe2+-dependent dioxygenase [Sphingosinicella microcystinivorans]|uniref:Fe2+-dependent dioxygenase n=1 Tax=Sphingosinicella microcystinivorans TaxID=335406 RepID=UPI0022F3A6BA|nr:Fe2+-dependent dioxygenase [Sphingosinicella microcystinivorans]WBX84233.1 Fe2+-dependent dioxygenase [Sphingosinicella microcystinivorans]